MTRALAVLLVAAALPACHADNLLAGLPDAATPDADSPDACSGGAHIVYLNRSPTLLTPGPFDSVANTTGLVTQPTTTAGPSISDADWHSAVACVAERLAPFDVRVTDQDPGAVDHVEMVVTQSSTEIGQNGLSGIFEASCPDGGPRPISIVFYDIFAPTHQLAFCELMVTGVGMMAGLSYAADCHDMMSQVYSDGNGGCGQKALLQTPSNCVDPAGQPTTCRCGGNTQISYEGFLSYFGPSQCTP